MFVIAAAAAGLIIWLAAGPALRRRRRRALQQRPAPGAWIDDLNLHVAYYRRMPEALRGELHGLMQVFLAEKHFVGCNGQKITDPIRVSIAAQACTLLLNRDAGVFDELSSVLVYPRAFYVRHRVEDSFGLHHVDEQVLAGESWDLGQVIVSWEDARYGAHYEGDGQNVVLHEFAHQLDAESGEVNGAPPHRSSAALAQWSETMQAEFIDLRQRIERGEHDVLDDYAAESPEEFFAVATEAFFETPRELARARPALYDRFRAYFCVDPAAW